MNQEAHVLKAWEDVTSLLVVAIGYIFWRLGLMDARDYGNLKINLYFLDRLDKRIAVVEV